MRPPCEQVQNEFLPALRWSVSNLLSDSGHSQVEIAQALNLTQAAVSKYLRQPAPESNLMESIEKLSSRVVEMVGHEGYESEAVKEICSVCMKLRIGSTICENHRATNEALADQQCSICSDLLGGADTTLTSHSELLGKFQRALKIIENSRNFAALIPQVRANIVVCGENPKSTHDVAGIPGRITTVNGQTHITTSPRFGSSHHTADILLGVKEIANRTKVCICVKGDDHAIDLLRKRHISIHEIDKGTTDPKEIIAGISDFDISADYFGIHVPGDIGVEPVVYLFGEDAIDLVQILEEIGAAYRGT